jgi:hypothetical protein
MTAGASGPVGAALGVCVLFATAQAAAQETVTAPPAPPPQPSFYAPIPDRGYHRHDGTFLRFAASGGRLGMSESTGASELSASGNGSGLGASIGGAVIENVILFGEIAALDARADVTVKGTPYDAQGAALSLWWFGPGVAYYLEPTNIFFSATIVFSRLDLLADDGTLLTKTRRGIGLNATAGKEWWISANWGLGLGVQLQYGRMRDWAPDPSPLIHANLISLLATATYN